MHYIFMDTLYKKNKIKAQLHGLYLVNVVNILWYLLMKIFVRIGKTHRLTEL